MKKWMLGLMLVSTAVYGMDESKGGAAASSATEERAPKRARPGTGDEFVGTVSQIVATAAMQTPDLYVGSTENFLVFKTTSDLVIKKGSEALIVPQELWSKFD